MSKFSLHNTVNRSAVNKSKIATYSCLKLSLLQSEYLTFFLAKKKKFAKIIYLPPPTFFIYIDFYLHIHYTFLPHTCEILIHIISYKSVPNALFVFYFIIFWSPITWTFLLHTKLSVLDQGPALDALWHALPIPMGNWTWDLGVLSVKLSSWN